MRKFVFLFGSVLAVCLQAYPNSSEPKPVEEIGTCQLITQKALAAGLISIVQVEKRLYFVFEDLEAKLRAAGVDERYIAYFIEVIQRLQITKQAIDSLPQMVHREAATLARRNPLRIDTKVRVPYGNGETRQRNEVKILRHPKDRLYFYRLTNGYSAIKSDWNYTLPPLPDYTLRGEDKIYESSILTDILRQLLDSNPTLPNDQNELIRFSVSLLYDALSIATEFDFRLWLKANGGIKNLKKRDWPFSSFASFEGDSFTVEDIYHALAIRTRVLGYLQPMIDYGFDQRVSLSNSLERLAYDTLFKEIGSGFFEINQLPEPPNFFRATNMFWEAMRFTIVDKGALKPQPVSQ